MLTDEEKCAETTNPTQDMRVYLQLKCNYKHFKITILKEVGNNEAAAKVK